MGHTNKKSNNSNAKSDLKKLEIQNKDERITEDSSKITDSIEVRRSTRLTAILAILAIIGAVCSLIYKLTINAVDNWPQSGHVYYVYMWVLFISALAAIILTFCNVTIYVIADLKRYNINNEHFASFDLESDKKYELLIKDFTTILIGLFCIFVLIIPISMTVSDNYFFVSNWIIIVIFIIGVLVYLGILIKQKRLLNIIKNLKECLIKWFLVGGLVYFFILVCFAINKNKIDIIFSDTGLIEVRHTSNTNYGELSITIYDENGNKIYTDVIDDSKILLAKENSYNSINSDSGDIKAESIRVSGEKIYWKYVLELDEILLEDGKYYIEMLSVKESSKANIINTVCKKRNVYTFGIDVISKEY